LNEHDLNDFGYYFHKALASIQNIMHNAVFTLGTEVLMAYFMAGMALFRLL